MSGQSLSKSANQLVAPYGSSRAAKDVPFVVGGSFHPIHVSASWKMLVRKFDDKDLGAVLESGKGFPWYFPVDGVEGMSGPVVPFHEFLAKSRGLLLAAFWSHWVNRCVIVSPLIVRLVLDAGMNGTSLDDTGSE